MGFVDDLKSAALGLVDPYVRPPWLDRLQPGSYTPPNLPPGIGKLTYDFEDLRIVGNNKGTAFEFADAEGTYVKPRGASSRRYPMRIYFSGPNYDQVANAFAKGLDQKGVGRLEHPIDGPLDVVPLGRWSRSDRLVSNANMAIFEVTFFVTIDAVWPTAQIDPQAAVLSAIADFNVAAAVQLADQLDLDSALEVASFKDKYDALVKRASNVLRVITDKQNDVKRKFDGIVDSINNGIDVLIRDPLTLAAQTKVMLGEPARALADIRARLEAYKNLASDIFGSDDAVATPVFDGPGSPGSPGFGPGNDSQSPNTFHLYDLFVTGAVVGQILSAINNEFTTAPDAILAAEEILSLNDDMVAWQDENWEAIGDSTFSTQSNLDTGEGYQQLQQAVALVAGFLIEISFTLKQERSIVLDRARAPIELCAELYGDLSDETYDAFLVSNDFTGDEMNELPRGKEVIYYV
jgi:hypothetical protein